MRRIAVAAFSLMVALVVFSCDKAADPLVDGSEALMAPGGGNSGALPHDGRCVSYCARAKTYIYVGKGPEVPVNDPNFSEADWIPFDWDGDGLPESCLRDFIPEAGEVMCHKMPPGGCPEIDSDGDGVYDRCVQPGDGLGFWCRLMHGEDTHKQAHMEDEALMAPGARDNSYFGRCVAYCNRAIVYMFVDDGDGKGGLTVPENDPNFDEDDWVPIDVDGDGEIEKCTKEEIDGETCFKVFGGCPEPDGTCGARPEDGIGFWCRLMKGKDPHEYAN